jgi:hypothetical protein
MYWSFIMGATDRLPTLAETKSTCLLNYVFLTLLFIFLSLWEWLLIHTKSLLATVFEIWKSEFIWASIMRLYSNCLWNNLLTFRLDTKSPLSCRFLLVAKTSMRNRDINHCYVTYRLTRNMLCLVSRAGKTNDEPSQFWLAGHRAWAE